ncbi:MAG TPA: Uma2 family endonuclease [Solirubrobacterales bacterium]|nr:Uma2 family endonuclease [Solirubrobacterales bacterium]
MASEPRPRVSVEEYLTLERQAETKSEYLNGEIVAMSGASRPHNLIVANVLASLHAQLRGRSCEVYASDMRVRVPAADLYTYPDVVVVCGEPQFDDAELDTLLNPTLTVEVLSPTTQSYDRGIKFAYYRTLPSLAEYLLLAQDRVHAEHSVRQGGAAWLLTETDRSVDILELPSIGCALALGDAYERVVSAG